MRTFRQFVLLPLVVCLALCAFAGHALAQAAGSRVVGTVKSISGASVVVTLDNGTDSTITFTDSARIVRAVPGQADLKSALPIHVSDIQVGDRISAHVQAGDNNSLLGASALVMSKGDIAQKQQREREEWRKGVGGIVKSVDTSSGTIAIPNSLAGSGKQILIHTSPQTEIRRYSADSVKFEDAKTSTLDQIKVGDQVRARGTKNEDGSEFTAQAIVSGSFREMAATVISADAGNRSVTVTDLATKKPITIKIGPDSMLRKLPQMMAVGIAMRLKGVSPGGAPSGAGGPAGSGASGNGAAAGNGTPRWQGAGGQGGGQGWHRRPGRIRRLSWGERPSRFATNSRPHAANAAHGTGQGRRCHAGCDRRKFRVRTNGDNDPRRSRADFDRGSAWNECGSNRVVSLEPGIGWCWRRRCRGWAVKPFSCVERKVCGSFF
jgi:hypothetical protein